MKNLLKFSLSLSLLSLIISCQPKKKYEYIETVQEINLSGIIERKDNEPKIIEAESDSIAYLDAFQKFTISKKISNDMKETYSHYSKMPLGFKIINEEGLDITYTTSFKKMDSLKTEIETRIASQDSGIKESHENYKERQKENIVIDSVKIAELKNHFTYKKDEFSNTAKTWVEPKNAPKYTNQNALICYFSIENDIPQNFRLRMQYHSEDWLFIDKVIFSIDDKVFTYIPLKVDRDNGNGGYIWEWFDESANINDELINALANAKSAKMKLIGNQYHDIKNITPKQILYIKRSLEYYKALGGQ